MLQGIKLNLDFYMTYIYQRHVNHITRKGIANPKRDI